MSSNLAGRTIVSRACGQFPAGALFFATAARRASFPHLAARPVKMWSRRIYPRLCSWRGTGNNQNGRHPPQRCRYARRMRRVNGTVTAGLTEAISGKPGWHHLPDCAGQVSNPQQGVLSREHALLPALAPPPPPLCMVIAAPPVRRDTSIPVPALWHGGAVHSPIARCSMGMTRSLFVPAMRGGFRCVCRVARNTRFPANI